MYSLKLIVASTLYFPPSASTYVVSLTFFLYFALKTLLEKEALFITNFISKSASPNEITF